MLSNLRVKLRCCALGSELELGLIRGGMTPKLNILKHNELKCKVNRPANAEICFEEVMREAYGLKIKS